jgi:tellurite resistance-related uncharacterized protein
MERTIDGFHQDEHGDWVADLACLHRQHVRHRPPFRDRAWVTTAEGRAAHIDTALDCPLCDRAEMPEDLSVTRTAGPFDDETLPAGLRRNHRVAERTWAVVRVLAGKARLTVETTPRIERELTAGDAQAIPPSVVHSVHVEGPVLLAIDFLTSANT